MTGRAMDAERYRDLFFQETRELLASLNQALVALERAPGDEAGLREIYRMMHSFKGMAATVGYQRSADLAHSLESILDGALHGHVGMTGDLMDLFFKSADELDRLTMPTAGAEPWNETTEALLEELLHASGRTTVAVPAPHDPGDALPAPRPSAPQRATSTLRINVKRLDNLINLAGELLIIKGRLMDLRGGASAPIQQAIDQLARVSENLQTEVLQARMFPIGSVFDRFARSVRDLARQAGKQVDLVISGQDIELDRSILDEIGEPLMHLLRNAVHHGIESPEVRARRGKPATGTIRLSAGREAERVVLEVHDDGKGIDPQELRAVAVQKAFVAAEHAPGMSAEEVMALLFLPGFSTADDVTEVAGRGVGLNIVKTRIETLKGTVAVQSAPAAGTRVTLRLPPTLAIIEALLVQVRAETFAIPMADVAQIVEVNFSAADITARNLLSVRDQTLSLVDLARALHLANGTPRQGTGFVLIAAQAEQPTGAIVDHVLGRQEIVIKPVERLLQQVAAFSGATVLGDGRVVLILDLPALLREGAAHASPARRI